MQRIDAQTESRAFRVFRNSIHTEKTFERYKYGLDKFCQFTGLDAEDYLKDKIIFKQSAEYVLSLTKKWGKATA